MQILFVTSAPLLQGPGGPTSALASVRYRVLIPARELSRAGHAVQIASTPEAGWNEVALQGLAADHVVFSKSFSVTNEVLAKRMREQGARIWFDICDNHFLHPTNRQHFEAMIDLADGLIASTPQLAEELLKRKGRPCAVVTDPVEGERAEPAFAPQLPRVRLLWFGHPGNLPGLTAQIGNLATLAQGLPIELRIVTALGPELQAFGAEHARLGGPFRVEVDPWSPEATRAALARSDLVILPANAGEYASAKSPNRLTESLWAGRAVVAHPVPAYQPFADCAWIGQDIAQGIRETVEARESMALRIAAGQRLVGRLHAPFVIGRGWLDALSLAAIPLRLNLGCGDKILPDYVNVDVAASRGGRRPDVLCDLHELLPFADGIADEILSVHVIEHFWRWEVEAVLREWVRVLRPGGKLVIECPNISSACAQFSSDPVSGAQPDQRGQRTMWVFYGDPAWRDPLMVHRWGYTPETLIELLRSCGLTEVRQEPAQFKLREPRDMRVVGLRPA